MFSNLASYLLGYGDSSSAPQEASTPEAGEDVRLKVSETEEDEWLMVDALGGARSRRSSTASLPCFPMEESWFVTPPPCFTSTGPVMVETSPLENLLIEHPSMSVYHHGGLAHPAREVLTPARTRSLSPAQRVPPVPVRHRPRAPLHINQLQNMQTQAFTAQKQEKFKESLTLKAKQMERSNKNLSRRNKRQRKDKQRNHSGANNNRKCC